MTNVGYLHFFLMKSELLKKMTNLRNDQGKDALQVKIFL